MTFKELGLGGLATGTGAAVTLSALGVPAAWPFVGRMYVHQYDPQAFFDAAKTWLEVHDNVTTARQNVERLVDGAAVTAWRSEDGRAFQRRMDAYLADLRSIEIRAMVTALVLYTVGGALAAMIFFQCLVAAALAAVAAWVLVAAITPFSLAAAGASATQALTRLYAGYAKTEQLLDALLHGCAGALATTITADVGYEALRGDSSALRDLGYATMAQGPLLIWGTANRIERDLTARALGGVHPAGRLWPQAKAGLPLPQGLPQIAGAKAFHDILGGQQTITGQITPEQAADGSYSFPWE
ncbi:MULTISPECIES: hypothetical protein [Streptosporangium]|uniref:Uncharacterized protein n=1 Tax=Streptosporangium brasiliense TaxID=47480 RepID=A0ABT9REX0_9ACTN|nr:hypothetical protein [Streptosporangium brasiliense]MDP9866930.1 hypothetical protein [Streptosporangium brasiliense]